MMLSCTIRQTARENSTIGAMSVRNSSTAAATVLLAGETPTHLLPMRFVGLGESMSLCATLLTETSPFFLGSFFMGETRL